MDEETASSSGGDVPAGAGNWGADSSEEIHWRFSQIKGNIESDDTPTDGEFFTNSKRPPTSNQSRFQQTSYHVWR